MQNVNDISLSGRAGSNGERKGNGPIKFSLARGGGLKKGSETERWPTEWFEVMAWENSCPEASDVRKGNKVLVRGSVKIETWDDKRNGEKRSKLVIVAKSIEFEISEGMMKQEIAQGSIKPLGKAQQEITDDDIPF